jgi:regulator of chromosome condensation
MRVVILLGLGARRTVSCGGADGGAGTCGGAREQRGGGLRSHAGAERGRGAVYSCGWGADGRLGHGNEEDQLTPRVVEGLLGVRACAVAAGCMHSLVLAASGAVYAFGLGEYGRLGHGDGNNQLTPKVIEALRSVRVCAVAAGGAHNLVLDAGGDVYSFGSGHNGKLGHGDRADRPTRLVIKALKGVKVSVVAAGGHHSLVVGSAGESTRLGWVLVAAWATVTMSTRRRQR